MANRKSKRKRKKAEGIPMVTFALMTGGALGGYLAGEIIFYFRPHPIHWATALGAGLAGYLIGTFIYHRFGDVI